MFGKILEVKQEKNKVIFLFEQGTGIIEIINHWVVNVFSPLKTDEYKSKAIESLKVEECKINVETTVTHIQITTNKLKINVYENFIVDFYDEMGNILCEDYRGERKPFVRRGNGGKLEEEGHKVLENIKENKVQVIKKLMGDEKFYGLGDKTGHLNKRAYDYEMWNTDEPAPHVESHKSLYKSIPFFITLRDKFVFGIFFDNTYKSYFDMGKENSEYYYFAAEDGNLNYYFIYGDKMEQVISRYTDLTGKTPLPQMWALGYQQSRWSYDTKDRVMEIAENFRKYDIPIDVIHMDIDYMDGYRVFTFDNNKFPDFKKIMDDLKGMGIKVVTIIDPGVKKDKGYFVYEKGLKNNYYVKDKDGIPYVNEVWPGDSVYPDFADKNVRDWWAENQRIMIEEGVSGIWNDMNEPASFKGPLPNDVVFNDEGIESDHREFHNLYGHLMSKATFKGIKKYTRKRPFVITRACYAGSQKYTTVWTGDNQSFWEHLRLSIPMLLNLGMSGMAFCGCDVGGFSFDCTSELLSRWVQVGCFSPLFRNHSAIHSRDQEPWAFDEETLNINRKYIKLRYKLLPYIYDLMHESECNGLPPMRALVIHYSNDKNVYNINDEFLFGKNILVAPVVEQGKTYRALYLPKGKWFDYWTKEKINGQQIIIRNAPIDVCPMYVKEGSIIPNYPDQRYVGEKVIDELTLDIYEGNGDYEHYEDDGESYNYKDGKYNLYRIIQRVKEDISIKFKKIHIGYDSSYKYLKIIFNSSKVKLVTFNNDNVDFVENDNNIEFKINATEGEIKITLI
jgi:alpha-glucosidase